MSLPEDEKEQEELKIQLNKEKNLLLKKISTLNQELVINASPNQRFELKQTIDEMEKRLSQVNSQIAQINAEKIAKQESLRKQLQPKITPIVEHTKNIHTLPIQHNVRIIPVRNKKLFLAIVFTTLLIISYDSTITVVNGMINIEASSQTNTMVERQISAEVINNSKLTWLEQIGKGMQTEAIKNELYPEIREKVNSELGFQKWAWVGAINFMILSLLTFILFILHSYTIRLKIYTLKSKIFNTLNFVIFVTFIITLGLTIKIQTSFPESLLPCLFSSGVVISMILVMFSSWPWFFELREILSNSQELQTIFSQKKEYLLFSFVVISGIALGVCLSLLLQNIAAIIFLNGMALAAFIKLFKHLYDEIPKDSLYYDWKSRFKRW